MEFEARKLFLITKCLTNFSGTFVAAVSILLGIVATPAFSAGVEWTLTPTAKLQQNYTDNFNLTDEDALDVWSTQASGGLNSKFQSDQWVVGTDLSYLHEQFWGESDLNRDDAEVSLGSTYTSQYWKFDLNGSYKRDQPSSSDADLQTGDILFDRITRLTGTVNPGLTWLITERTNLGMSYQFIDVSYKDVENANQAQLVFIPDDPGADFLERNETNRTDFIRHVGDLTLRHQLAEPTSIFAKASYNRTVNDQANFENDQYILSAGVDHSFSDSFAVAVTAGGIWLNSKTPDLVPGRTTNADTGEIVQGSRSSTSDQNSESDLGYLVNLQVRKQFEYSQVVGSYSHDFIPTLTGGILEEDRGAVDWQQNWTEYFSSTLGILASTTDTVGEAAVENGRKSITARLELAWQFTENWFLAGGYQYRWQDQDSRTGRDTANTVFLSLRYDWDPYFVLP